MFTGIVEEVGTVRRSGPGLLVEAGRVGVDAVAGESVCVNGVCLTVVSRAPDERTILGFDLSAETLARTALGAVAPGDRVNLERSVTLLTRLGGHLVQGHVDGVGRVAEVREVGEGRDMRISLPDGLSRYVVEKGSIAVDGVSLTVTGIEGGLFGVALVPYTLEATGLGGLRTGDPVNVEVDIMAKYVERLLQEAR